MAAPHSSTYEVLRKIDHAHLWHPFTQHQLWQESQPAIIENAQGVELITVEGERLLDGVSSLWCNVHGHGVPEIVGAIQKQAEKLCHSTLLGLSHRPVIELTEQLLRFVPAKLTRAFYCDSGTAATEAALRMSLEWWQLRGRPEKRKFCSLIGGYHGDTLGAVAVGYHEDFHRHLAGIAPRAFQVSPPHLFRFEQETSEEESVTQSISELRALFQTHSKTIAALIFEPVVQGAAGMWVQPVPYLRQVAALCQEFEVLLIADEVATGFGKTGKMFAIEHGPISPDLLVLGKGLTGGYLPLSAVFATEEIFSGFLGNPEEQKTFFYGQTFSGNPLAASAAIASLNLIAAPEFFTHLGTRIAHFHRELRSLIEPLAAVSEVRAVGLMTGIEFTKVPGMRTAYPVRERIGQRIALEARKRGAFIRPLGNVMVLMPALAMEEKDLSHLVRITQESIVAVLGGERL